MNDKKYFIISLTWVDWLTLLSFLFASLGLTSALHQKLTLAIAFMLIAMFIDMLDGFLARRMNLESDFGRYLDSFCDTVIYLFLPMFILYQFGMQDWLSLFAFFVFILCGFLRLSRFNIIGSVNENGTAYYIGLQVFWSQLLVVLAFPFWAWLKEDAQYPLLIIILVMSFFMIRDIKFPKPVYYIPQTIIIILVTLIYICLHFTGIDSP